MRNRGLCKRLKLQREIQTRGSRMCGHRDLISLWEIFEVYLQQLQVKRRKGSGMGRRTEQECKKG